MKSLAIKLFVAFVSGVAIGGVGGYFLRKKSEATFEEVSEEEFEKIVQECEKNQENPTKNDEKEEVVAFKEDGELPKTNENESVKYNYYEQWKKKYDTRTKEEPDDVKVTIDPEFSKEIGEEPIDIQPITMEEFYEVAGAFRSDVAAVRVNWFAKDNVICDENEEPVDNPDRKFGFVVGHVFDLFEKEDPDVLYLRNSKQKVVYEIVKYDASYGDRVSEEEYGGTED